MILEDFVMLAKTVPEPSSDGRIFVCSAGWSEEIRSLVRLYPLAMRGAPPTWSVNRVAVERNPKDSRAESWRLRGDRKFKHDAINSRFETLRSLGSSTIQAINDRFPLTTQEDADARRLSLAVVQPDAPPKLCFSENVESDDHPQLALFAETAEERQKLGAKRFPYQPRLQYTVDGRHHEHQLREWGVYEWLRKRGPEGRHDHPVRSRLGENPRLLIGNMANKRNVWMVLALLRPLQQSDLFVSRQREAVA